VKIAVDSWAWFSKDALSSVQILKLKQSLTLQPQKVGDYPGDDPSPLHLYEERPDKFGVPRGFFFKYRRPDHEIIPSYTEGDKSAWHSDLSFSGRLEPDQEKAVAQICDAFESGDLGGILCAGCGWGKTVATLALIARLNVPTLITVHKGFLMRQWLERIARFLPKALVGVVQQDRCEFKGRHIVVAMNDSLIARDYGACFRNHFGLIISDEVHRIGAPTWSQIPPRFPARWRLGLSATPRRKDGAEDVFWHHIGPILYTGRTQRLKPVIKRVHTGFVLPKGDKINQGLLKKTILLKFLVQNKKRNMIIVNQIQQAARSGRKILVLSERLDQHLRVLDDLLRKTWEPEWGILPTIGYYIGGMKDGDYEKAEEAQVIFATAQLVQEALDIPPLDTLILATPISDVEQAVGRIQRPYPGKKEPIVVDIRDDNIGLCKRAAFSRWNLYYKKSWVRSMDF
jgi:superfamily II DNA or RNA helicase